MKFIKSTVLLVITAILFLGLQACKEKSDESNSNNGLETAQEPQEEVTFEKAEDCDQFIDQYEEWSEEYIAFLSKYKDEPMKAVTSPEYGQMMSKASSWSQEWLSISVSCAQNSSYEEKVEAIMNRMEEKIEELGFK